MKPLVTVVMPVYNSERFLAQSIESILQQTHKDFVFFIIDDGSTDNSAQIIQKFAAQDPRIVFFKNEGNLGLIATLNRYFEKVETDYIARMDADDIALPSRLEDQLNFLKVNGHIGIVGSSVVVVDTNLSTLTKDGKYPESHFLILWKMLYTSGFSHPAVMMRKDIFTMLKGYSPSMLYVEDYDFFLRAKEITQFANLRKQLLKYRINEYSVSSTHYRVQQENHMKLFRLYMTSFLSEKDGELLLNFLRFHTVEQTADFVKIYRLLDSLYAIFIAKNNPTLKVRNAIRQDKNRLLSILALTYKSRLFWPGIFMYFRVVFQSPSILFFNLKNRANV